MGLEDATRLTLSGMDSDSVLNALPTPMVITRLDGTLLKINRRAAELFAMRAGQMIGKSFIPFYHAPERRAEMIAKLLQNGSVQDFDVMLRDANDRPFWALLSCVLTETRDGPVIFAVVVDNTGRREAVEGLRQARDRFQDLAEGSIQGIMIHQYFKPVFANPAYARMFGYDSVEELLNLGTVMPLIAPHDRLRMEDYLRRRLMDEAAPETFEYQGMRRDGTPVWLLNTVRLVDWDGVLALQNTVIDISEQKATEARLKSAEQRLHNAIESINEGFVLWDEDDRLVLFNNRFKSQHKAVKDILKPGLTHKAFTDALIDRRHFSHERKPRTDLARRLYDLHQAGGAMQQALAGDRWLLASEHKTGDGGTVGTYTDISSLKQAETMRADFVANASHELRTPLSILLGFLETLQGPAKDDAAARENFLGIMQQQAARMAQLVEDLLSLSRIEINAEMKPTDRIVLRDVLISTIGDLAARTEASGTAVTLDLASDLPPVLGDANELHQVFYNLIENALKYGPEGGTVTVSAKRRCRRSSALPEVPGDRYIAVSVRDEGEGISPEHLPRLTERFYRVDDARSREIGGTGLGLAIVKHILNRHRAELEIKSKPGQGSTFTVYLPPAGAEDAAARSDAGNHRHRDHNQKPGSDYARSA